MILIKPSRKTTSRDNTYDPLMRKKEVNNILAEPYYHS